LHRVEGLLRRWSYEGETVLPDDVAAFYRVSVRCGFSTPEAFRKALAKWRQAIREVYAKVFKTECRSAGVMGGNPQSHHSNTPIVPPYIFPRWRATS
jgi:glutamine synthetase adenylyltransferase